MSGETTAYDRIPYPAGSYPQSHPDRLATLATLFGMDPPDIRACRVLELGCADGSNLAPALQHRWLRRSVGKSSTHQHP